MSDNQVLQILTDQFGEREGKSILRLLKDHVTRQNDQQGAMAKALDQLQDGIPLQYITQTAWFYGRPFRVTPAVLIPRPETEELVYWVHQDLGKNPTTSILDIGTGSGCIAITLALELTGSRIDASDVTQDALNVARKNADKYDVDIGFECRDFLADGIGPGRAYDAIVSNPPYVGPDETDLMDAWVSGHEPRQALWAPGEDPLVFYRKIALDARHSLTPGGAVYVELNALRSDDIQAIFEDAGWGTEMRRDLQGQWRMLKAEPA